MKYLLFFSVFLFSVNVVLASDISQFVFTTNSQTIKPNEVSEKITIQAQDANGQSVAGGIPQTGCLKLETTSVTGQFSSNSTNWESVSQLTMNKGWANRNFYYKDSTTGNYTLTVKSALTSCSGWIKEEWIAKQDITVSESAFTPESKSEPPEPTYDVGSIVWPTEPQIYANTGEDKVGVTGADIKFSGQALGLQKEPLENARYLWSFGDGAGAEGQNILHTYHYPGEYIVVLNVSSGKYSASDRLSVKVLPNQLTITEATKDYIKLHNGSNFDLDISHWFLRANSKLFKFPESTLIKAGADLPISSSISGISVNNNQTVELLYPNGSTAHSFFTDVQYLVSNKIIAPEPTTVIGPIEQKQIEVLTQINPVSDNEENTQQVASAISVGQNNSWGLKKWLAIILGISLVSGIGFLLIRRQSSV